MSDDAQVTLDGHVFRLTNLGKVLYPVTGTTKADVIGYYAQIAEVMVPAVRDRAVTRKRWPNGVDTQPFFQKNIDKSTPAWVPRFEIDHHSGVNVYPVVDSPATLAWFGQNAALEIHVPQWRFGADGAIGHPDRVVFDLDPGPGVELAECARIAIAVRDRLSRDGHITVPVTSGSKGIHLYAALDGSLSSEAASDYAHAIARELEQQMPDRVLSRMTKSLRTGKVFLDWSQNNGNKTTIGPYSLRGRDHPMVAAPRDWDELTDPGISQLDYQQVLRRAADGLDPMADLDPERAKKAVRAAVPVDDKLATYRSKRSADRTPEPVPDQGALPVGNDDTFVIQEHHARALHWDFRLERAGVLVSWALPKGIPTDGRANRLAVQTEDHPLDYADFAGVIPKGEYGGGWVTIWDAGHYETEKWRDDEVIITMAGARAQGRFAIIRTRGNQWLMHRTKDQPALPPVVPLDEKDRPSAGARVWHSDRADSPDGADGADSADSADSADGHSTHRAGDSTAAPARTAVPTDLRPMLATAAGPDELPAGPTWRLEGKWDGVRAIVRVAAGRVRLTSRNDKDMTATYPELAEVAALLAGHEAVLDGEIVALDGAGRTDFSTLQQRMKLTRAAEIARVADDNPVLLYVFDVLFLDGVPLVGKKFDDRRRILEALPLVGDFVRIPDQLTGSLNDELDRTRELGWEGVVAKAADSVYLPGRRAPSWRKIKNFRTQEAVVVGWRPGNGRRTGSLGSLLLALPDGEGWTYIGRVGSGFSDDALDQALQQLEPLARKSTAVTSVMPRAETRDANWVTPRLVGEVRFTEWSRDDLLRQATWRGFRPDKDAAEVVRES